MDGHDCAIWYPDDVHGHGPVRAERERTDIFWGKYESGHTQPMGIPIEDCGDVQAADRAEPLTDQSC